MKISSVMNRSVATCAVTESCLEAARIMRDRKVGLVVVQDLRRAKVAGVVTDRDICMAGLVHEKPLSQIPVTEAMTKQVHTCIDGMDVSTAHHTMRTQHVRRLPVVDAGGALVGVVSLSDLARQAAAEEKSSQRAPEVTQTLARVALAQSRATALR